MIERGPEKTAIRLIVNGQNQVLEVEPRRTLLDALRVDLGLTGAKQVCNMGNCGACTVLLDGVAVYSCLTLAIECEGKTITTIEGLSQGELLHPIQQAFVQHDALQCGFARRARCWRRTRSCSVIPTRARRRLSRACRGTCVAAARIVASSMQ